MCNNFTMLTFFPKKYMIQTNTNILQIIVCKLVCLPFNISRHFSFFSLSVSGKSPHPIAGGGTLLWRRRRRVLLGGGRLGRDLFLWWKRRGWTCRAADDIKRGRTGEEFNSGKLTVPNTRRREGQGVERVPPDVGKGQKIWWVGYF